MSRTPGGESADGPWRPDPPGPAGRSAGRSAGGSARRPGRRSLLCHDIVDDPDQGVGLYGAVAAQDTTGLCADEWADRLEAIERIKSRMAAWEAEAIAGFDDSLHGISADLGH